MLASIDLKNLQYPFVKSLFPLKNPSGTELHTSHVYITTEKGPGQRLYCARIITKNLHYVEKIFCYGKNKRINDDNFDPITGKISLLLPNTLFLLFLKLQGNKPSISTGVPLQSVGKQKILYLALCIQYISKQFIGQNNRH